MDREVAKAFQGTGTLSAEEGEDLVALYFRAKSSYWKEVYQESTLDGLESGLRKIKGATLGFGPFTWFESRLLSDEKGIKMHLWLQNLATRNVIGFRSSGWHNLVLGQKPGSQA